MNAKDIEVGVLLQNKAMLAVFARSSLPMKQNLADGTVHVTLSPAETPWPTSTAS